MGGGGDALRRVSTGKILSEYIGPELRNKLDNPIEFKGFVAGPAHGFKATVLIDEGVDIL